ncbi:teichoic acid D-Ala incorporation-associated protein DltX [Lentilactobacillus diolivorans]|uniref:Cytochrome c554 n=1 Tax=Lentilactobacillus diolivorans TaxID=179838 RepID=A0ABQ0XGL0_9LACO|nr:teichoic acid D-Ala incorporation-associated protein DltX [Lentilactobacillus diolivorans]GEP25197.1 cytochrome c554 [Lentilactobacillus diolivorans]
MNLRTWARHPTVKFILTTLFYFAIMVILIYLYDYSGVNHSKFIYNEF